MINLPHWDFKPWVAGAFEWCRWLLITYQPWIMLFAAIGFASALLTLIPFLMGMKDEEEKDYEYYDDDY